MTGDPEKYEGKVWYGRLMQPSGPFQVPSSQVEGLVLERRIGPDEPERQDGLDGQTATAAIARNH